MKQCSYKFWIASGIPLIHLAAAVPMQAQIVRDTTLPVKSVVELRNGNILNVRGGTKAGSNLFHSFSKFNVTEGQQVFFVDPGVRNILSRVTGNDQSKIFGKLGVIDGNANLFLINPKGVIFGPKASLDLTGSFAATTANALQFGNQGFFSASIPNNPQLLTVNPSAFLFKQIATQPIINRSNQFNEGLKVNDGQSLLLVGGDVKLDGGVLTAPGGRVELGGVVGKGTVGLNVASNNLHLSFPKRVALADVSLTNQASTVVTARDGGSIAINARNLDILQGSSISGGILFGLGSASSQAGDITLSTTGAITITNSQIRNLTFDDGSAGNVIINASGNASLTKSSILSETSGAGDGGDISINTRSLSLTEGAGLLANSSASGKAGQVLIDASNDVLIEGGSFISTAAQSAVDPTGKAGDISIKARSLSLSKAASLFTLTQGEGDAGDISIKARSFSLARNAVLFTSTKGEGDAGDVMVKADIFRAANGSQIRTTTLGSGDAGDITIEEAEEVTLSGARTGLFANTTAGSTGDGGDITIKANKQLTVRDGARIKVNSLGTGTAGTISIDPDLISFNRGVLTAETESGTGGNIFLQGGSLQLRNNSLISTEARNDGDGGNINIDVDTFIALGNSDITANASGVGSGGNVRITTLGLFRSPDSDITAKSERGIDGVVEFNTPDVDPDEAVANLPEQVVDVGGLVAQSCSTGGGAIARRSSEFVLTGRGGLPPTPSEALKSDTVLVDLGTPVASSQELSSTGKLLPMTSGQVTPEKLLHQASSQIVNYSSPASTDLTHIASGPITEAQGWITDPNGEVVLTTQAPTATPNGFGLASAACHGS